MNDAHWLLPEGIDEILPPQALELEQMRRKLLDLLHSWGYDLVMPPMIEYLESLLTGTGSDLDLRTFKLTDQITGRTLGIRADITPQAARIDAHQLRQDNPTRLCYVGTVLNTRSDGFAGSRSPIQLGAELYGHAGVESDQEVITLMVQLLECAGVGALSIDLGHVGIFRGLAQQANLSEQQELQLFDALQRKAVAEIDELLAQFELSESSTNMLQALAHLSGDDALTEARAVLANAPQNVSDALSQLEQVSSRLASIRPDLQVHFDLAELRGYHYHTGLVYAAFTAGLGQEVARGGRYDDIGELFGRARPACGFTTDLRILMNQCAGQTVGGESAILAPAIDDLSLYSKVEALRVQGRRVIYSLPGQSGSAKEMGCDAELQLQGSSWVVVKV